MHTAWNFTRDPTDVTAHQMLKQCLASVRRKTVERANTLHRSAHNCQHASDAGPVSDAIDLNVRRVFLSEKHGLTSPPLQLRLRRNRKYAFYFYKGAESYLASSAGGREDPKPFSTSQTPPLCKCANTTKRKPLCASVLAFL